ncbi:MAG: hypothetical protein IT326_10215, partial [Anaerolineae bacterium]|nr:hypothetical protein [Anaerolineae bacterium]
IAPVEFVALNFDFHPRFVRETLDRAGFRPGRTLSVSIFRLEVLKRLIPTGLLVALDSALQFSGGLIRIAPSIFTRNDAIGPDESAPEGAFWRCPSCDSYDLVRHDEAMHCGGCGARWGIINGVYDFKEPLP